MSSSSTAVQARALYRSMLRELPPRPRSSPRSPLQRGIRQTFESVPRGEAGMATPSVVRRQLQQGEQYVQYARAQRTYVTLLERYNPGMSMDDEERVRMTVQRVGMHMPQEWKPEGKD